MPDPVEKPVRFVLLATCFVLLVWIAEVAGAWLVFLSCFGLAFGGWAVINGSAGWIAWLVGLFSLVVLLTYFVVLPLSRRTDWYTRLKNRKPL